MTPGIARELLFLIANLQDIGIGDKLLNNGQIDLLRKGHLSQATIEGIAYGIAKVLESRRLNK